MRGTGARLARAQWAPLAALAVLTFVSALLATAVPSRTTAGYDRAAAAAVGPAADIRVRGRRAAAPPSPPCPARPPSAPTPSPGSSGCPAR
ncbi:hypothetical protein [Actinomadura madurae]|nr:hypothetical protein [Actinomadura madurae]MCP9982600.1 hypothetical protein [Actinomadura madurae]MCQ0005854.1 hypothetical protein [Actinomadura madurae]